MRTLPRHIGAEEAAARLRRPSGWARLMLRRARPCVRMELVWVPSFLFTFHMALPRHPGETTVAVDACSGAFAIFQMHADLVDAAPEGGEVLPAALEAGEAERLGRDKLLQAILRQRGSKGPKPEPRETLHAETIHTPFWVYYYWRRPDCLDVRLLNACTGEKGGNLTKAGVLRAFASARANKEARG